MARTKKERHKRKKVAKQLGISIKHQNERFSTITLNFQRMWDLEKLCELRGWDVRGHREQILFLFRFHALLVYGKPEIAYKKMLELNDQFIEPYDRVEDTYSAETMWCKIQDKTKAEEIRRATGIKNGVEYKRGGYFYRNQTLIELLEITAEEERHLSTIISELEKHRRKKNRKVARKQYQSQKRREAGQKTRKEYLTPTVQRRKKAKDLRSQGLSIRDIAKQLDCSKSTIQRYLSQEKAEQEKTSVPFYGSLDCVGYTLRSDIHSNIAQQSKESVSNLLAWYSSKINVEDLSHIFYDPQVAELASSGWSDPMLFQVSANVPPWLEPHIIKYSVAWFYIHKRH